MLEFGGGLTVESTEGQGSLFRAFMPAADDDGAASDDGANGAVLRAKETGANPRGR